MKSGALELQCPAPEIGRNSIWRTLLPLFAWLALVWVLVARVTGPSDIWDQTQPRTLSYTTDMLVTGGDHWLLPSDPSGVRATKPPLYNWMAVPFVNALGYSSELAHKFPSVIAVCGCWLLLVRLGRHIDFHPDQMLGWCAALIFPANYTVFKLSYLARPDMLLTLWLLAAWISSTAVLLRAARSGGRVDNRWLVVAFWVSVSLAGLTKGPAAVVAIVYPPIAAWALCGSFRGVFALRPVGALLPAVIVGGWLALVDRIDPHHFWEQLWFNEVYGRVTGTGPEGARDGSIAWLTGLLNHFGYYVMRFLPWSLLSLAAMIVLWRTRRSPQRAWLESTSGTDAGRSNCRDWMVAAALFAWIVVGLFTFSAGKRADYIAPAFAPASLLAAGWLLRMSPAYVNRALWIAPLAAAICLSALSAENRLEPVSPRRGFGKSISTFISQASQAMALERVPVFIIWSDATPLHPMLGLSRNDLQYDALAAADARQKFWVIAGLKTREPHEFSQWLKERNAKARIEVVVQSELMPRHDHWPEQVTLYLVDAERKPKIKKRKRTPKP